MYSSLHILSLFLPTEYTVLTFEHQNARRPVHRVIVSILESSLQSTHTFNCARNSNWISIANCLSDTRTHSVLNDESVNDRGERGRGWEYRDRVSYVSKDRTMSPSTWWFDRRLHTRNRDAIICNCAVHVTVVCDSIAKLNAWSIIVILRESCTLPGEKYRQKFVEVNPLYHLILLKVNWNHRSRDHLECTFFYTRAIVSSRLVKCKILVFYFCLKVYWFIIKPLSRIMMFRRKWVATQMTQWKIAFERNCRLFC